jgi:hypothetical protein
VGARLHELRVELRERALDLCLLAEVLRPQRPPPTLSAAAYAKAKTRRRQRPRRGGD